MNAIDNLPDSFSFSNGWLHNFKTIFDIHAKRICGEGAYIDPKIIETERIKLQQILKCCDKYDILNADEAGLFYELLPNYTLAITNEIITNTFKSKLRVTVILCCNASGTFKHTLLIIVKAKKPRSFLTNTELKNLNVQYTNSTSS